MTVDETFQPNLPWGDSLAINDQIDPNRLRIFSQNINGLSPRLGSQKMTSVCESIQRFQASIVALQETNTNWSHPACTNLLPTALCRVWSRSKAVTSATEIPTDHRDQTGGTCTWAVDQWSSRVVQTSTDSPLGRWSSLTLQGSYEKKVTVISAYRVCQSQVDLSRPFTAAAQQGAILVEMHRPCDPRSAALEDLTIFIRSLYDKRHEVILCIDANEGVTTTKGNQSAFQLFLDDCDLTDALSYLHGNDSPPTHQRGSSRIDYIALSPGLLHALRAGGILPLAEGHDSDHRGIFIDLDSRLVFAGPTAPIKPPPSRQLTTTNPSALSKYITKMSCLFLEHDIMRQLKRLQRSFSIDGASAENISSYDKIDQWMTDRMLHAERKCSRRRRAGYAWSPTLSTAALTVRYWSLRLRQQRHRIDVRSELNRLAIRGSIPTADHGKTYTHEDLLARLRAAKSTLRTHQMNARTLRDEHLVQRAKFLADQHHRADDSVVLSVLQKRETSAHRFAILRRTFKGPFATGLEFIDVPDCSNPVSHNRLFDREAVHDAILRSNQRRFMQTKTTPFGDGDRLNHLGLHCDGPGTKDLLRGKYRYRRTDLSQEGNIWLSLLRYREMVESGTRIDLEITAEDFTQAWLKYRESTSSSPSRRHYGHYKAAAIAFRAKQHTKSGKSNPLWFPDLALFHASMCEMPLRYGFSPSRWKMSVNAMIEKSNKSTVVDKLRIIHLFEADFNFVLKLIWGKRLLRFAEDKGWLGQDQHGSRPGRQAIDGVMEKRLIYDFARLTRSSVVTIDNDARSCYDRIIKALAMPVCVSMGLPTTAAAMHNSVHYGMEHKVKTAHGISDDSYGRSGVTPLEGTGQGSGASPAIWLLLSVSLLRALRRLADGITIADPIDQARTIIHTVFYVDDGMPVVGDFPNPTDKSWSELSKLASHTAQVWERLLHISGGALELSKCFSYAMIWNWATGRPRLTHPARLSHRVTVTDSESGTQATLPLIDPNEGRRTLGVRISPAGNDNCEYAFRCDQGKEIAEALKRQVMSRAVAWIAYTSIITPKIEYPLAATTFSRKQCERIMSTYLPTTLRKLGFPRNFPREIVFGDKDEGGIGIHHLFIEQGIRQLCFLVGHLRQKSRTGKILLVTLRWAELQAGVSFPILENPEPPIPWVDSCWITCLRTFMAQYKFKLSIACQKPGGHGPRVNDCCLMERLGARFPGTRAYKINACRLYLRVKWLSDITTGDGRQILPSILRCQRSLSRRSTHRWPRQPRPQAAWIKVWRDAIGEVFLRNRNSVQLNQASRLGGWLSVADTGWVAWFDPMSGTLFRKEYDGLTRSYPAARPILGFPSASIIGATYLGNLPEECIPVTIHVHERVYSISASSRLPSPSREIRTASPIAEYITGLQDWVQDFVTGVKFVDENLGPLRGRNTVYLMVKGLSSRTCNVFSWRLTSKGRTLASATRQVGYLLQCKSSRTTRHGVCSGLAFATIVQVYLRSRDGAHQQTPVEVWGLSDRDNQWLHQASATGRRFCPSRRCNDDEDLASVIRWISGIISIKTTVLESASSSQLTKSNRGWLRETTARLERIEKDTSHHTAHRPAGWNDTVVVWEPATVAAIHKGRGVITGSLLKECRKLCSATSPATYFRRRYEWDSAVWELVDTSGCGEAIAKYAFNDRVRIAKLRTGWLSVNKRARHYVEGRSQKCPSCAETEDVSHLFTCSATSRGSTWATDLQSALNEIDEKSEASEMLSNAVLSWQGGATPQANDCSSPLVRQAFDDQKRIGWHLLCRGFVAKGWGTAHAACSSKHNGEVWAVTLHRRIFDGFLRLWTERNLAVHGSIQEQRVRDVISLSDKIKEIYQWKQKILPSDARRIFSFTIDEVNAKPRSIQRQWLRLASKMLPDAVHRRQKLPRGQTLITGFLPHRAGLADDPP